MTTTLRKGGNLLLSDEAPGIERVRIGMGWNSGPGASSVELDGIVSVAPKSAGGARLLLAHQVPNPDESAAASPSTDPVVGDAEKLAVVLAAVPPAVSRVVFGMAIYDAAARRQTFRSVRGAYIRVLNDANGIEIARYTLEAAAGSETAMMLGELYRNPRGWKFRAVGQGYASGLRGIAGAPSGELATVRPVEVVEWLRRISPARTRRTIAEHLDPPKADAQAPRGTPSPAPAAPAAPPPAAQPSQRAQPAPAARPAQPTRPAQPARPAQPSRPARQTRPAQPARPTAAKQPERSLLDLSERDKAPGTGGANRSSRSRKAPSSTSSSSTSAPPASGSGRSGARIEFGEHSSRYRQRLEHVTSLDEDHPVTTWTEHDRGTGGMTITLRWEALRTSTGLPRPSDLHLACLWQASDGTSGLMQTLGNTLNAPGAGSSRQVLALGRRDEREGQTIFVDLAALPTFKRFFVFVYGQHGSPEWELLRPALTVEAPSGEHLAMRLDDVPPSARLCVIASFHVFQGDLIIRREGDCVEGLQSQAAPQYGFELDWNADGMTVRAALGR